MSILSRIRSELAYVRGFTRALRRTTSIARQPTHTIRDLAEDPAQKYGDRVALISERETFTYREWNARANLYAHWARTHSLQKGDVVALFMPGRPEYLSIWLGIAKAGGITALLNTSLFDAPLAHCINVVNAKIVIVAAELLGQFETAKSLLRPGIEILVHGPSDAYPRIDTALAHCSPENQPLAERVPLTINDKCIYIYTSGTTGLPKAANINHYRLQLAMHGYSAVIAATEKDRMYDCLPLYHTVGGITAPGAVLTVGGSCVIRDKFSAREFWSDIVRHDCTVFCYIGELCRYLLNSPPGPYDEAHRLRLCYGNGLRPDIWVPFRDRFKIPEIREFYAATEGNVTIFNFDSKPGAVGRIPKWVEHKFIIKIVRFDYEKEEPIRNAEGFCIECSPDEVGEVLGEIIDDPGKPAARFEGYADAQASAKKIMRNVFRPGDAWFRSGDLMRKDRQGYFYFIDRIGDTYRWKGENVATNEVSEALTGFGRFQETNVYGVKVPGREGRAGMAALVVDDVETFDLAAFHAYLAQHLPDYARPVFLRFSEKIDITATFKQKKLELVREGFDPALIRDRLYYNDVVTGRFLPVDGEVYARICASEIRL